MRNERERFFAGNRMTSAGYFGNWSGGRPGASKFNVDVGVWNQVVLEEGLTNITEIINYF